jgi:hypothetical protein
MARKLLLSPPHGARKATRGRCEIPEPGGRPGVKAIARGEGRAGCRRTNPSIIDKDKRDVVLGPPSANTKRWVSCRKAAVVLATRAGVISREEACERYALCPEELATWEAAFDQDGSAACGSRAFRITAGATGRP